MEQHDQSQRQQARQIYRQQQREGSGSGQGQHPTSGSIERFRQSAYVQQSPGSGSSVGRAGGDAQQVYGLTSSAQYGTGPTMQPSPLHYAQEIPAPEAARQQSHQYPQYGSNLLYGMGQPPGSQAAQPSYEQVPPYRQRPGSASETLATQFGVPQYYLAGQAVPAGATVPELATQNVPSQYPQPDTYPDSGPSAAHAYPANVMDPSQSATYNPYAQQPQYTPQLQIPSDEQAFESYQAQVRNIFTLARDGSLRDVGARLLEISQYLLGNVEALGEGYLRTEWLVNKSDGELGLTRDDETLHDGRIRLWDEFNRSWLVSLQRQLDLTQQVMHNNQPLEGNQSIMDAQTLERLSSELVRLCDNVEKHGLVDYQMGVAEEETMERRLLQ